MRMDSVADLVAKYLDHYPDEHAHLARVTALIAQFPQLSDLIVRTNFVGHITASGFVLSPDRRRVLLVAHQGLGMFLQPGGHLDVGDVSFQAGALREVREETGLDSMVPVSLVAGNTEIPFDIDSHYIPSNPKKGEPEHWHHDFRYVFICNDDSPMRLAQEEVSDARWVSLDEIEQYPTFERVGVKLRKFALS
jgi:8-oxo-dGTP pyrophosphatase MutT (NUDIX family)